MGVAFESCLRLEGGSHAGASLANAIDANKRVLYLRSHDGSIVGRQLLALSSDFGLLRYRVYCTLSKELVPAVEAEFERFTRSLGAALRAQLAEHGQPENLHGCPWYDDRPLRALGDQDPPTGSKGFESQRMFQAYFAKLGLEAPEPTPRWIAEATLGTPGLQLSLPAMAQLCNDLFSSWCDRSVLHFELADRLVRDFDRAQVISLARLRAHWPLCMILLRASSRQGLEAVLRTALELGVEQLAYYAIGDVLGSTHGVLRDAPCSWGIVESLPSSTQQPRSRRDVCASPHALSACCWPGAR